MSTKAKSKRLVKVTATERDDGAVDYKVELARGSSVQESAFGCCAIAMSLFNEKVIDDPRGFVNLIMHYVDESLLNTTEEGDTNNVG